MKAQIEQLYEEAVKKLKNAKSIADIESVDTEYLGRKKGQLNAILKGIKDLSDDEKREVGPLANEIRTKLEKALQDRRNAIEDEKWASTEESIDISMPSKTCCGVGSIHPMTKVVGDLEDIFTSMGFAVYEGPELDSEFSNFTSLNIPSWHPARDMQDTFWIDEDLLLRTQTSSMQVRIMQELGPPLRAIVTGRVYRNEDLDASHEHTLHQLEGFIIDKDISISHLIGTLRTMLAGVFGRDDVKVRLRPGYFPFVEPGFEMDMSCMVCGGDGCAFCKKTGWVETLGCGMIHPKVLEYGGIDPKEYSGFAFGLGTMRLAMQKYGIDDIRVLNSGDLRFLKQF